ncbi:hypothetical protein [Aquisphaera insulae]|uniref:hypothetical protein n=1 Tax=Aquisphaera insulae TaxID=2712864 RepID=UPI0013E9AE6C|nr:hypothetical protein [Aquisphaera insulae]
MIDKSSHISKRQSVLLGRLVMFCERCGSIDLPVRVSQVIGYGSFFRGKESPNDIDALVVAPDDHPLFDKFIAIVRDQIEKRYVANPAEKMEQLAASHVDPEVASSSDLFSGWLSGISYDSLFEARNIIQEITRFEAPRFAERILGQDLPRIRFHVERRDDSMTAKVTHVIWTPKRPDVRANVERIWKSDNREDLLTEANWFEQQHRYYLVVNEVLIRAIRRLAQDRTLVPGRWTDEKVQKWIRKTEIGFPQEFVASVLDGTSSMSKDIPTPPGYVEPRFDVMNTSSLAAAVEEKRRGLRCLMDRKRVLSVITNCLIHRLFVDRKALRRPLEGFLREAIEERMYRRELKLKRMRSVIDEEVALALLVEPS